MPEVTSAEPGQDVGYRGCKDEQTFWELKCYFLGFGAPDPVDRFVNLERVVSWKERYSGIDIRVAEDRFGDIIECSSCLSGLSHCSDGQNDC